MSTGPRSSPERLDLILRQVHADDVSRARALIDRAVADADAAWVPRNATAEALIAALRDLTSQPAQLRVDA